MSEAREVSSPIYDDEIANLLPIGIKFTIEKFSELTGLKHSSAVSRLRVLTLKHCLNVKKTGRKCAYSMNKRQRKMMIDDRNNKVKDKNKTSIYHKYANKVNAREKAKADKYKAAEDILKKARFI